MVNCPLCNANITKLIFDKEECNFFKCTACEAVFVWPQPALEKIYQMYQQLGQEYYLDKRKIALYYNSSFEERLSPLEPYRKNNRLLDVGCSIGAFLSAAKDKGWDAYGVELSRASADYARKVKGLNVFCGTLQEAKYCSEHFDVVNLWAVLEHMPDPLSTILEVSRVLRRGGLMVFDVPNIDCLPFRIIGKRYRYIAPSHFFYFNLKTIEKLLADTSFKIKKISSEYFSPLTFIEDIRGKSPCTLKTETRERTIVAKSKTRKIHALIIRPVWRSFMFFIRKLYLGEELKVLAEKS